jgi:hypothetical protein
LERESSDDAGDVEVKTEVGRIWSRNLQMTPGDVAVKTEIGGIWSRNLQIVHMVCILLGEERIDGVVD